MGEKDSDGWSSKSLFIDFQRIENLLNAIVHPAGMIPPDAIWQNLCQNSSIVLVLHKQALPFILDFTLSCYNWLVNVHASCLVNANQQFSFAFLYYHIIEHSVLS